MVAHDRPLPSYTEADLIHIAQLALYQLATNESRQSKAGFTSPGDHSRPSRFSDRGISNSIYNNKQLSTISADTEHYLRPTSIKMLSKISDIAT
jgi:hypothetical protein